MASPLKLAVHFTLDFIALWTSLALLFRLRNLPIHLRSRDFARCLQFLCIADALYAPSRVVATLVYSIMGVRDPMVLMWIQLWAEFSLVSAVFGEMLLAMLFALQVRSCKHLLRWLRHSAWGPWFWAMWPIITALVALARQTPRARWLDSFGIASIMVFGFLFTSMAYAVMLTSSASATGAAWPRQKRRAVLFLANYCVTMLPAMITPFVALSISSDAVIKVFTNVSAICLRLNAPVNSMTYYAQSRYSKANEETRGRRPTEHCELSFVVRVGGVSAISNHQSFSRAASTGNTSKADRGDCDDDDRGDCDDEDEPEPEQPKQEKQQKQQPPASAPPGSRKCLPRSFTEARKPASSSRPTSFSNNSVGWMGQMM